MHLFGLTGGIASGKSAVGARLRSVGVPIIDADQLSRDAVLPGSEGLKKIVERFGDVLLPDGSLDRKKLASIAFANEENRKGLNSIVHPEVTRLTFEAAAGLREKGEPLACYEAALIVENGVQDVFRPLVVVSAPEELQVARTMKRDGASEEEARARIRAQMPLAGKVAVADFVIENTGGLEELHAKTDAVLAEICARLGVDVDRYKMR
jgi:dephospho-CoA kinase